MQEFMVVTDEQMLFMAEMKISKAAEKEGRALTVTRPMLWQALNDITAWRERALAAEKALKELKASSV